MKEIFYRQLGPNDQEGYRNLRLFCLQQYPDNFGTTYEEELQSGSLQFSNAINAADEYNFAFGAFTGQQKLVGICGFVTGARLKTRHRGEIIQMFTDPVYKGLGIGKTLLGLCTAKAFGNGQTTQVVLGVVAGNYSAIRLYQQSGFVEYGTLQNYFCAEGKCFTQLFFCLTKEPVL